ncbi:MAG: hypothetical protein ABW047_14200, partial [Nitrospiraceae bacterium]
ELMWSCTSSRSDHAAHGNEIRDGARQVVLHQLCKVFIEMAREAPSIGRQPVYENEDRLSQT